MPVPSLRELLRPRRTNPAPARPPSRRLPVQHRERLEGPLILVSDLAFDAQAQVRAVAGVAKRAGVPLWLVASPHRNAQRHLQLTEEHLDRLGWESPEVHLVREPLDAAGLSQLSEAVDASLIVVDGHVDVPAFSSQQIESLVQRCRRPLLRVGDPAPFLRWVNHQHPLQVAIGVDHSAPSAAARAWLALLATAGPVEVSALHVFWPAEALTKFGLPHPGWYGEARKELVEALERDVQALLAPLSERLPVRLRLVLGAGRIGDALSDAAAEAGASLLVVGTHHRRGVSRLWSVAHQALRQFEESVLVVPAEASAHAPLLSHVPVGSALVATDLSESSTQVLPYAMGLLAPGGVLHLVHVIPSELTEEEQRIVRHRLKALVPRDLRENGKQVRLHVVPSDEAPGVALVRLAERLGAETVCLTSSARSGVSRVLRSSTASYLLSHCTQPVLLLGGGAAVSHA